MIVLKSVNPDQIINFYRTLGLVFIPEQHGNGPIHHSAKIGSLIFEIYPDPATPSINIRLGFTVVKLDQIVAQLQKQGIKVISQPKSTVWGYQAIIADPDGRKIELTEKPVES